MLPAPLPMLHMRPEAGSSTLACFDAAAAMATPSQLALQLFSAKVRLRWRSAPAPLSAAPCLCVQADELMEGIGQEARSQLYEYNSQNLANSVRAGASSSEAQRSGASRACDAARICCRLCHPSCAAHSPLSLPFTAIPNRVGIRCSSVQRLSLCRGLPRAVPPFHPLLTARPPLHATPPAGVGVCQHRCESGGGAAAGLCTGCHPEDARVQVGPNEAKSAAPLEAASVLLLPAGHRRRLAWPSPQLLPPCPALPISCLPAAPRTSPTSCGPLPSWASRATCCLWRVRTLGGWVSAGTGTAFCRMAAAVPLAVSRLSATRHPSPVPCPLQRPLPAVLHPAPWQLAGTPRA